MAGGVRLYFDHNASSPLRPAARSAMLRALDAAGNPSSIHAEGRAARAIIEQARAQVAAAVGGRAQDVVFTSGATEGLNALLRPGVIPTTGPQRLAHFLIGETEHAAVLDGHGFASEAVTPIPVDASGLYDMHTLESALEKARNGGVFASALVVLQAANNETGVLQPLEAVGRLTASAGAPLIVDAVQVIGKMPFNLAACSAAAIVISAHKFGGPKGVGAIVFNGDRLRFGRALIAGGGQEMRRRAGTENVAAIAGMGEALAEAVRDVAQVSARQIALRGQIEQGILQIAPDAMIFGRDAPRLPNTTLVAIPGLKAETLLMAFDIAGIALSSGSACSSGKVGRSHVLAAMGVAPELAEGALRISTGWTTTEADAAQFLAQFASIITPFLQRRNRRAA
ncbi:MAG: cysteine desulfurase family protein [Beijerinckiaceae bacterium]